MLTGKQIARESPTKSSPKHSTLPTSQGVFPREACGTCRPPSHLYRLSRTRRTKHLHRQHRAHRPSPQGQHHRFGRIKQIPLRINTEFTTFSDFLQQHKLLENNAAQLLKIFNSNFIEPINNPSVHPIVRKTTLCFPSVNIVCAISLREETI